jgi:hypothetical protein
MADETTKLYQVLSGLNATDSKIWGKLSGLSGDISGAFNPNYIAIGTANGLNSSSFTIDSATGSATFDNTDAVISGKLPNELAIKNYVLGKIEEVETTQGTSLTGVQISPANSALTGTVSGKDLKLGLNTDNLTITQADGQLSSLLSLSGNTNPTGAASGFAAVYALVDADGHPHGDTINIPKDQFLKSAAYVPSAEVLRFTFATLDNGVETETTTDVAVADLVHEYVGGNGVAVAYDGTTAEGQTTISAVIDSEHNDGKYLTLNNNGIGLSGIDAAISRAGGNTSGYLWDETSGVIRKALSGYTDANKVSSTFEYLSGEINTINDKIGDDLGDATNSGQILDLDASGNVKASGYKFVSTTTSAALAEAGASTNIVNASAVSAFVDDKIAALNLDGTYFEQITAVNGDVALLSGDGTTIVDSGKKIGADDQAPSGFGAANTIATEAAVKLFVEENLNDLLTGRIEPLLAEIGE